MNFINGTKLQSVEKRFGPALPGQALPAKTVSALRYAGGRGKKFAGVPGIHPEAAFYIHFPLELNLSSIASKKGTIDFIADLKEDGPQSKQGRQAEVEAFLRNHGEKQREQLAKEEKSRLAAQQKAQKAESKKAEELRKKEEVASKNQAIERLCRQQKIVIEIEGQRYSAEAKITFSKKTQMFKVVAQFGQV
jgi:hypothetical protein